MEQSVAVRWITGLKKLPCLKQSNTQCTTSFMSDDLDEGSLSHHWHLMCASYNQRYSLETCQILSRFLVHILTNALRSMQFGVLTLATNSA